MCVLCLSCLAGCGGKERDAIKRVINLDKQYASSLKQLPPNSTASQYAWGIGRYCDAAEAMDMADCPADFVVAYRQHLRAWRAAQQAIAQLPDGLLEGLWMGFLNGLGGEMDGGQQRLSGAVGSAQERVRVTWEEVERIAAKHDVAPP
jgi:hypothetical protein